MKKQFKVFVGGLGIFSVLLAICLSACGPAAKPGDQAITIRLGYRPKALADVTPVIIKEMKVARAGVRVELVPVPSPTEAMQRLNAGELDAVAGIPLASILTQMETESPHFVAYYHQADVAGEGWVSLVVNKNMGVQQILDLAGKPCAALPTDQAKWLLRRILVAAGVPTQSVNIVVYNPLTPVAGLEAKEHAAIFGLEPAISSATLRGHKVLAKGPVSQYLYDGKPVIVSSSLLSKSFVLEHPSAYRSFLSMVDEAVMIAAENPGAVRSLFTTRDYGELSKDEADRLFMPVMMPPSEELRSTCIQYVDDLVRDGLLATRVDLTPLFPELIPISNESANESEHTEAGQVLSP